MIDLLPQEILIELFAYLPRSDLLSLTTTCKYLNETIGSSTASCNQLEIHFIPENRVLNWSGSRRYTRAYIEGRAAAHFTSIFEDFGVNLREIQLICVRLRGSVLKGILMNCENLKKVVIKDNKVSYEERDFQEPLPRLKLQTLSYRNFFSRTSEVFKLLKKCSTKELSIVGYTESCEDIKEFIRVQEDLETLSVQDARESTNIFRDPSFFSSSAFKLKKLMLDKVKVDVNLEKFIDNHRASLTHMELNGIDQRILRIASKFPKLTTVKIFDMTIDEPVALPSVTALTVGYDLSGKWAECFPNVTSLKVTWIRPQSDLMQIERLRSLERLHIDFCCIPELNIRTVKRLKLTDVGYSTWRPFRMENNRLEEVVVENGMQCEWLGLFVEEFSRNLKLLRVKNANMSDECKAIVKNAKNIVVQLI